MKKYFVIGNPISHSLSPKLHNFWFKKYNLNAKYEKLLLEKDNLNKIVQKVKTGEISGLNVTVPFKQLIIPYLEKLSPEAQRSVASAIPNVAPAFGGTSVANIDPTNPIVNPDPATQALAQALSQRPPS